MEVVKGLGWEKDRRPLKVKIKEGAKYKMYNVLGKIADGVVDFFDICIRYVDIRNVLLQKLFAKVSANRAIVV